jgi:hypothetical protein
MEDHVEMYAPLPETGRHGYGDRGRKQSANSRAPLTPFPGEVADCLPDPGTPPFFLSPTVQKSILDFSFTQLDDKSGRTSDRIKEQMTSQLTNLGVTAALLLSIEASFIFAIRDGSLFESPDDRPRLQLCFGTIVAAAVVMLTTAVAHAVYMLLMVSEFGCVDEIACWLQKIGRMQTLPARLFMAGLLLFMASCALSMVAIFPAASDYGTILVVVLVVHAICHSMLSKITASFYEAIHEVNQGWRVSAPVAKGD